LNKPKEIAGKAEKTLRRSANSSASFAFQKMFTHKQPAKEKLVVALDVDSAERAFELSDQLRDVVGMFKVGLQLFTAAGPDIVRRIVSRGGRVFLDLKFHDIPNTVAAAGVEATRLGVSIFNVHASGGSAMMRRTAQIINDTAEREGLAKPKLLAVTLLTSLDRNDLNQIGFVEEPGSRVRKLARLAADSGLDGVVASPQEIRVVREEVTNPSFLIVTPGIRALPLPEDDQRRMLTAAQAIAEGADYIVVGRPILDARDPQQAARLIVEQMEKSLPTNSRR